jgi:hypothetical protein
VSWTVTFSLVGVVLYTVSDHVYVQVASLECGSQSPARADEEHMRGMRAAKAAGRNRRRRMRAD